MAEPKWPPGYKMESADAKRLGKDVTLPLPNREIRRKFKKLQHKKHFRDKVAEQGQEIPEETSTVDPTAQAELLKNLDVQKFLGILNGLLTGQKKLVVESKPVKFSATDQTHGFQHTFLVQDVNDV